MNEWGFGGEIKSRWDQQFAEHPEWGLSRCEIEKQNDGSQKRADLSLIKDDGKTVVLVLELRLPDHLQPNPWDVGNLGGAAGKALDAGAR